MSSSGASTRSRVNRRSPAPSGTIAASCAYVEESNDEEVFRSLRLAMVDEQLRYRGIRDERVLEVMSEVPRHLFVPWAIQAIAYDDRALPIGQGQTISQPYMVARMVEALELVGNERVLDIGTGSGYQAAVLGELAREVWSVEIVPELADEARKRLARLGYSNVHVRVANGSLGLPERAPFDAIVVAAGAPEVPQSLVDQLGPGGRLVIPTGELGLQMLCRIKRVGRMGDETASEALVPCAFVPLVGREGWSGLGRSKANVRPRHGS